MPHSLPVDISLILPAYNEARQIANTIGEARAYFQSIGLTCQIIVSADGDDGTHDLVADLAREDALLHVIGSPKRGGKGLGIRRAIPLASGQFIGFADADNKTPITEFDKVLPHLRDGCDVVIGSRAASEARIERKQALYRQVGARGFAIFMHLVVGLNDIADTQCGFKFFQRDVALDLFSRQQIDGYMFDVEILYLASQAGYRIAQVPIRWRDDGDSRLELILGNLRNGIDVFRIRLADPRQRHPN